GLPQRCAYRMAPKLRKRPGAAIRNRLGPHRCAPEGKRIAWGLAAQTRNPHPLSTAQPAAPPAREPWFHVLYLQVLLAVVVGIVIGVCTPDFGKSLKPLGDGFIKLVKMMIAPIIFCTVVHGVASMSDMRRLGRVGFKTLLYFEVVSTLALAIGLMVVNLLKPGAGFNIDPTALDPELGKTYAQKAHSLDAVSFFRHIITNALI